MPKNKNYSHQTGGHENAVKEYGRVDASPHTRPYLEAVEEDQDEIPEPAKTRHRPRGGLQGREYQRRLLARRGGRLITIEAA